MGKLAQGQLTMRLLPSEAIVGAISSNDLVTDNIILFTKKGKFRKINTAHLRACKRGDLGNIGIKLNETKKDSDYVVNISNGSNLIGIITNENRNARIEGSSIKTLNKEEKDLIIPNLRKNEFITDIVQLIKPFE